MAERFPRLSREEEQSLFIAWRDTCDVAAREKLVRANLRYVVQLAWMYRNYQTDLDELIAEGNLGIIRALEKFDPDKGNRFVTYLVAWVRTYIVNYILRNWSLVYGSKALRPEAFFRLRREYARNLGLVGDDEKAKELLSESFHLPVEKITAMLIRMGHDVSLDVNYTTDPDNPPLLNTLVCQADDLDLALGKMRNATAAQVLVSSILQTLHPREQYIAEHRLMAYEESKETLAEIGRHLGVSRERVRQLEMGAIVKLKHRIQLHWRAALTPHLQEGSDA
jgi:RNA polymerase sigma-32 factor